MFGETKRIIDFLNKHHLDTGRALMLLPFAITDSQHTHIHTWRQVHESKCICERVSLRQKKILYVNFSMDSCHTDIVAATHKTIKSKSIMLLLPIHGSPYHIIRIVLFRSNFVHWLIWNAIRLLSIIFASGLDWTEFMMCMQLMGAFDTIAFDSVCVK